MRSIGTRRVSRRSALGAGVVAALLTLAPLTTLAAEGEPEGVTGVDWVLTSLAVDGTMGPVPEGVTPTLRLEDGQVSGSTGCNSFSGSYTLDATSLTFGALATTAMACADPLGAVEGPYLVALALVGGWSLTDGTLQLLDAAGQPLLEYSSQAASLEGTTWILAQQAVDGALSPIPDGVLATLLMQDGASGGSGGCNSWFGDYTLDGTSLTFSDIGSTMMFCEGPAGEVEQAYLANLADVATYTIVGSQLNLLSADGAPLLVFDAAPAPSIAGSWVATSIAMGSGVVSSANDQCRHRRLHRGWGDRADRTAATATTGPTRSMVGRSRSAISRPRRWPARATSSTSNRSPTVRLSRPRRSGTSSRTASSRCTPPRATCSSRTPRPRRSGPVTPQREAGDVERSRRELLRTGGVAALVGLAAVLGRPFPMSAQDEDRKDKKKRRNADDSGGGDSAPPSTTITTSRSPALEVTNNAKQGEAVAINGVSSSSEGTAGLFVASNDGTALHTRGRNPVRRPVGDRVGDRRRRVRHPRAGRTTRGRPRARHAPGSPRGRPRRVGERPRRGRGTHRRPAQPGARGAGQGRLDRPRLTGRARRVRV